MEEIEKIEEYWRFTKADAKVNELIGVILRLEKRVKELEDKIEELEYDSMEEFD